MLERLAKGVPTGHLDKNCPLRDKAWQFAYSNLRKFIKGVAGRRETKLANTVRDNEARELAGSRGRINNEARKAQQRVAKRGGGDGARGFPAGSGWRDSPTKDPRCASSGTVHV